MLSVKLIEKEPEGLISFNEACPGNVLIHHKTKIVYLVVGQKTSIKRLVPICNYACNFDILDPVNLDTKYYLRREAKLEINL